MAAIVLPQKFQFVNSSAAPPSSGFRSKAQKHNNRQEQGQGGQNTDVKGGDEEELRRRGEARKANSHAAKVAHARRRRFMILEYQGPHGETSQVLSEQNQRAMGVESGHGAENGMDMSRGPESRGQADPAIATWARDKDCLLDRATVLELVTNGLLEMAGIEVGEMGTGFGMDMRGNGVGDPRSVLGAGRLDPFRSFARGLSEEEGFLFDHYIRFVIPFQSTHCNRILSTEAYQRTMVQDFTPLSYSRADALDSVFLITCRHIVTVLSSPELSPLMRLPPGEKEYYNAMATRYKVSCIKGLRESIARESGEGGRGWSNETVVCMLMLTSDELWSGDLEMARKHLKGAFQVVKMKGGPKTLGCNGFMEKVMGMTLEDARATPVCQRTLMSS